MIINLFEEYIYLTDHAFNSDGEFTIKKRIEKTYMITSNQYYKTMRTDGYYV